MAPFVDATPTGSDDFSGRNTKRTGALIARSPSSHELIQHPTILGVTERLLHRAQSFQLHLTQVISIGPDSPGQPIHRDQWAFDFFEFPSDYDVQCNTIWALTDFTEANGATRLMPGSQHLPNAHGPHRRRDRAGRDDRRIVPALHGQGVPRRWRQHLRRHPDGPQHHLRRRLAPPRGEPVPVVPARGCGGRCPTSCCG